MVRVLVGTAVTLIPIAFLPDAGWGISGQLGPANYPEEYAAARTVLADPPPGDLLVLPFTSYRAPAWNHDRRVLDPLPRYLQPDYVVNDQLSVDGRILAGEDPRTPRVLAALRLPHSRERSAALARLGIGIVARELDVPTSRTYDADLAGRSLFAGRDLELTALDGPIDARDASHWRELVLGLAWTAYFGLVVGALWNLFQKARLGKARFTRE
jgi:hypothetical protein